MYSFGAGSNDLLRRIGSDKLAVMSDNLARCFVNDVADKISSGQTVFKWLDNRVAVLYVAHPDAFSCSAVVLSHDDIL